MYDKSIVTEFEVGTKLVFRIFSKPRAEPTAAFIGTVPISTAFAFTLNEVETNETAAKFADKFTGEPEV